MLTGLLDDLDARREGALLQVAGEPGIGKSRLLSELATQAATRGHLVLTGRAAEYEAELPFGVFGDALDDWLAGLDPGRLEAVAGGLAAELAIVLPVFEGLASDAARPPKLEQERYRAYRAVRALLSSLAGERPIVLVLDDVQWTDPGSVELLCHLLAHPPRGPVLVALGYRPAQLPAQLGVAFAAVLREPQTRRLDLRPLAGDAARDLLGPQVGDRLWRRLYRESGGNPFFLLQLARGDDVAGRPAAAPAAAPEIPEAVRAALSSELSSLSPPALMLLQGAAITGDPFDGELAAGAADIGAADAPDLLDELQSFGLVHRASAAGQFAFRHPIVRSTVYALAASGWRARAHARVAALLAARGAGPAAQAPHVERSAARGDEAAVGILVAAGASAAPSAPALAARWYGAAERLLPDAAGVAPHRIELLIAAATALAASGQLESSRSTLCEVLDRLAPVDPGRVAVVAYCAGIEHLLGRHRDAEGRLSRAHRLVRDTASADAVLLELELAAGAGYENRYTDMLRWAEQAYAGATRLARPALEVAAGGQITLANYFLGRPAGAAMDRAARGMDALTDAELAGRLDLGLWIGWTEAVLERHERAVEHCRRVIGVARATGQGATLLVTMTAQAWALIRLGRLDDAEETLAATLEGGHLAPSLFLSVAVGLSSVLATYRGELDAAVRAGEESVRLAEAADPGLIPGMSGLYLAIPLIELGQARRARDAVLATSSGGELRTSRSGDTAAYEVLTRASLALGDIEAAQGWACRAQAATHGGDLAAEAAFARRAIAVVALARGDAAGAARIAIEAAELADAAGAPVEAGRCRILAGNALVRAGRRADALRELDLAAQRLARIGAHGYRQQAEKALRRLGRRDDRGAAAPATAGRKGLQALTEREREIAELVRRGHTNRQIAGIVYASEKTIERQLSRIFAKLGVSSRAALASAVAEDARGR